MGKKKKTLVYTTLNGMKIVINEEAKLMKSLDIILDELSRMRTLVSEMRVLVSTRLKYTVSDEERNTLRICCNHLADFDHRFTSLLPELHTALIDASALLVCARSGSIEKLNTGIVSSCPTVQYDREALLSMRKQLSDVAELRGASYIKLKERLLIICSFMDWLMQMTDKHNFVLKSEGFRLIVNH
ncbi:hypothetical protein SAMN06296386_10913 [Lachnospiraceae bacterium]|nr:hypothetical protein SAMN06296386_10913 [Lachnospiraceae bacterium]